MSDPIGVDESPLIRGPQERYVVHLPLFEGPLDLLLHLIEKRQMEIATISLVAVTDQYLAYLQQWQTEDLPLANMAAFVTIAARLLYIKSHSLLPQISKEGTEDEVEGAAVIAQELQQHLLAYRQIKKIASILHQREEAGLQTHGRPVQLVGIEAQLSWTPPALIGMDVRVLARVFQRLLAVQAKGVEGSADLMPVARVRVSERIAEIMSRLEDRPSILLSEIIENEPSRLVIIVTFLAVLELWKWERINVKQEDLLEPIILERGERWADEEKEVIED